MVTAREAGATPWELHKRAWQGEFAPANSFDPPSCVESDGTAEQFLAVASRVARPLARKRILSGAPQGQAASHRGFLHPVPTASPSFPSTSRFSERPRAKMLTLKP